MPSKKRKYNARFPAGRIKKIMQTDEEVGKVAQAVPIIISRTLELFVESLLSKAMQVTMSRNAKTLSPSHVKQCILAESRFDFLRDLVKNIPDVSAAEEKEMLSAESSPNSSRYSDMPAPQRKIAREDSTSSSSSDVKITSVSTQTNDLKRTLSIDPDQPNKHPKIEDTPPEAAIDLTKKSEISTLDLTKKQEISIDLSKKPEFSIDLSKKPEFSIDLSKKAEFSIKTEEISAKPVRTANFYQETLVTDDLPLPHTHKSVIKVNPTYSSPQPSTSFTTVPRPLKPKLESPKILEKNAIPALVPIKPLINIDFSKNVSNPEIHLLDSRAAIVTVPTIDKVRCTNRKPRVKKSPAPKPIDLEHLSSGNLQIDEDYDT